MSSSNIKANNETNNNSDNNQEIWKTYEQAINNSEEIAKITGLTELRKITAGLDNLITIIGYQNPMQTMQSISSLQIKNPEKITAELLRLAKKTKNKELIELAEIYQEASTTTPTILPYIIGTIQELGLTNELIVTEEQKKAAGLELKIKGFTNPTEEQKTKWAETMISNGYKDILPIQGSENLTTEEVIAYSMANKPLLTSAGITNYTKATIHEILNNIGMKEQRNRIDPYMLNRMPTPEYRQISAPR